MINELCLAIQAVCIVCLSSITLQVGGSSLSLFHSLLARSQLVCLTYVVNICASIYCLLQHCAHVGFMHTCCSHTLTDATVSSKRKLSDTITLVKILISLVIVNVVYTITLLYILYHFDMNIFGLWNKWSELL